MTLAPTYNEQHLHWSLLAEPCQSTPCAGRMKTNKRHEAWALLWRKRQHSHLNGTSRSSVTQNNTLLWMSWRRVYKSYSREKIIILFCLNSKLRALRDLWSNQGWCSLVGNHGGYNGMYLSSAAIPAPFLAPGLWYVWNRYESLLLAQGTRCSAVT